MSAAELTAELLRAVKTLRESHVELQQQTIAYVRAEKDYRRAKAIAYLRSPGRNVVERESNAELKEINDKTLGDWRFDRDLAEGLKVSALEAVRSNRSVVSAIQTLAANERAEAELARWSSEEVS